MVGDYWDGGDCGSSQVSQVHSPIMMASKFPVIKGVVLSVFEKSESGKAEGTQQWVPRAYPLLLLPWYKMPSGTVLKCPRS